MGTIFLRFCPAAGEAEANTAAGMTGCSMPDTLLVHLGWRSRELYALVAGGNIQYAIESLQLLIFH